MGGCQNYDPLWGTLNIGCRILMGIQKGTIVLTTTHVVNLVFRLIFWGLGFRPRLAVCRRRLSTPWFRV